VEGFPNLDIYGIGRNFSFVLQELIMIDFFHFSKENTPKLCFTLEIDK
jgi:hypothetical protein